MTGFKQGNIGVVPGNIGGIYRQIFFLIGIHSMQGQQPLHDMELQEKEAQKD